MIKNPTEENRYLINSLPKDIKKAINSGIKDTEL